MNGVGTPPGPLGRYPEQDYKSCFIAYVKGKNPFMYQEYGFTYYQMCEAISQDTVISDFIIDFIRSAHSSGEIERAIDVLRNSRFSEEEVRQRMRGVADGR